MEPILNSPGLRTSTSWRSSRGLAHAVGVLGHHLERIGEMPDNPVEADATQTVLSLQFEAVFHDQHDVDVGGDDRTGELGITALEPDVDRSG